MENLTIKNLTASEGIKIENTNLFMTDNIKDLQINNLNFKNV